MGEEMELEALLPQRSRPVMRALLPARFLAEARKHTQAGRRMSEKQE